MAWWVEAFCAGSRQPGDSDLWAAWCTPKQRAFSRAVFLASEELCSPLSSFCLLIGLDEFGERRRNLDLKFNPVTSLAVPLTALWEQPYVRVGSAGPWLAAGLEGMKFNL